MKLTKHTIFYIILSILIIVFISKSISDYGINIFFFESYCFKSELSNIMNQYVEYVEDSVKVNKDEDIGSSSSRQDFCNGQAHFGGSQLVQEFSHSSPYSSNTIGLFLNFIGSEIHEIRQKNVILFVFTTMMITVAGLAIIKYHRKLKENQSKPRKGFSRTIKNNVLKKQNYRCDHCRRILTAVDFHHKNGNRSDNRERNCQALCPNCHAIRTRGLTK